MDPSSWKCDWYDRVGAYLTVFGAVLKIPISAHRRQSLGKAHVHEFKMCHVPLASAGLAERVNLEDR